MGKLKQPLFGAIVIVFQSCVSTANFQTARTLDPGKVEVIAGTSILYGNRLSLEADDTTPTDKYQYSISEAAVRVGVSNRIDLGAHFLGNGLGFEGKFRLSDPKGTIATATGFGYGQSSTGDELREYNINVRDVHVDFFVSFHLFDDWMALYASPRIYNRTLSGAETASMLLYYYSFGMKAGKDYGVYLESNFLKSTRSEYSLSQYAMGVFFVP